jgi:two-component system, LytTR family, response regulator
VKTIFIEDTESHRETIQQIMKSIKGVELMGNADSLSSGYDLINKTKPQLVLMDIELYPGTAFDLLEKIQIERQIDFEIIFLTGFANFEYPIRAIQYAALDFIMKPIDPEKLKAAVERAEKKILQQQAAFQNDLQIQLLLQNLKNLTERRSNRIALHRAKGLIDFVQIEDIVYLEADKEVTNIYFKDGRKIVAIKSLAYYSNPLTIDFNFFRISDKQLANLDYLQSYNHSDSYQLTLTNGTTLYASRRGGQDLKQQLNSTLDAVPILEPSILNTLINRLFGRS